MQTYPLSLPRAPDRPFLTPPLNDSDIMLSLHPLAPIIRNKAAIHVPPHSGVLREPRGPGPRCPHATRDAGHWQWSGPLVGLQQAGAEDPDQVERVWFGRRLGRRRGVGGARRAAEGSAGLAEQRLGVAGGEGGEVEQGVGQPRRVEPGPVLRVDCPHLVGETGCAGGLVVVWRRIGIHAAAGGQQMPTRWSEQAMLCSTVHLRIFRHVV